MISWTWIKGRRGIGWYAQIFIAAMKKIVSVIIKPTFMQISIFMNIIK